MNSAALTGFLIVDPDLRADGGSRLRFDADWGPNCLSYSEPLTLDNAGSSGR